MDQDEVIVVNHISKHFKVYLDKGHTIKDYIVSSKRRKYEKREVLKDISFSVKRGEAVGLIGHNGCGKSTTLKMLSKIIYPDSGSIEMHGRVSSLIELGAGFHPDMSGRENIYINASIFGLTRKEIDTRLDDIIAFSELEDFIDNPVRTYSSGMYMRLAFSVAINVNADILLVDEILAVGDVNFQAKCFNRLREIKSQGVTIVIVSHSTGQIEQICDRAFWINEGYIRSSGNASEVIDEYLHFMNGKKMESLVHEDKRRLEREKRDVLHNGAGVGESVGLETDEDKEMSLYEQSMDYNVKHFGLGTAVIKEAFIRNCNNERTYVLEADKNFSIEIYYEIKHEMNEIVVGMGFYTLDGVWIYGTNTLIGKKRISGREKKGKAVFVGEEMPLLSGKYILQVSVTDVDGTPLDFYRDYCHFDVINDKRDKGIVYIKNDWRINE